MYFHGGFLPSDDLSRNAGLYGLMPVSISATTELASPNTAPTARAGFKRSPWRACAAGTKATSNTRAPRARKARMDKMIRQGPVGPSQGPAALAVVGGLRGRAQALVRIRRGVRRRLRPVGPRRVREVDVVETAAVRRRGLYGRPLPAPPALHRNRHPRAAPVEVVPYLDAAGCVEPSAQLQRDRPGVPFDGRFSARAG